MMIRSLCAVSLGLLSVTVHARSIVGFDMSINVAPPPAQVVVVAPEGYDDCYIVPAMWDNEIWIPAHQECVYPESMGSSVWVSGYWGCTVPGPRGACGRWRWVSNYWRRDNSAAGVYIHGHEHGHGYGRRNGYEHGHGHEYRRGHGYQNEHGHVQDNRSHDHGASNIHQRGQAPAAPAIERGNVHHR
jgi:hypothetical protein